jgi:hypothetical protein
MRTPATGAYQDLWMQSHITASYVARATVSALLLAYAMIQNDLITMVAALLFTPFLGQILAAGLGLLNQDWRLVRQGFAALGVSTILTFLAGIIVAATIGGPLQFDQFSSVLTNLAISAIVAVVASLATGDIVGRREFIAMAAAAQFAIYPAWLGIMLVLGLPDASTVGQRLLTFGVNVVTMLVVSAAAYLFVRYRTEGIRAYAQHKAAEAGG